MPLSISTLPEYLAAALRSESHSFSARQDDGLSGYSLDTRRLRPLRVLHAALGMASEVGEFIDATKRSLFYEQPLDATNLMEELGDVMWYWALACDALQLDPIAVLQANLDKLRRRYPDQFQAELAMHRDLAAERRLLDGSMGCMVPAGTCRICGQQWDSATTCAHAVRATPDPVR